MPLDDEWARRYPAMLGRLACYSCAASDRFGWVCARRGEYVPGHIASEVIGPRGRDIDHWSHAGPPLTLAAAVVRFPREALAQGAGEYMRWAATVRRGTAREVRAELAAVLAEAQ